MDRNVHRVSVDEMEFGKVFRFGRILKAIGSSLQPARLGLSILVIALLGIGGLLYDAVAPPLPPQGLAVAPWDGQLTVAQTRLLRRAADRWTDLDLGFDDPVDAAVILGSMRTALATPGKVEATRFRDFIKDFDAVNGTRGRGAFEATVDWIGLQLANIVEGTLAIDPAGVIDASIAIAWQTPRRLFEHGHMWFLLIIGVWFLLVTAVLGGSLCRMEAVLVAEGRRLSSNDALAFAFRRMARAFAALVLPLVMAAGIAGILLVLGLLINVPVLNVLVTIGYGLSLVAALGLAILLLGYLVCGGMLMPAVAVDCCDAGDAMQRAYSYALSRPLHLVLYSAIGVIGLGLGLLVVLAVANATLALAAGLQGYWTWNGVFSDAGGAVEIFSQIDRPSAGASSGINRLAQWFIGFWEGLVILGVLGWIFSYLCAAWTRIYLLMRQASDHVGEDLIWHPGMMPGTLAPNFKSSDPSESHAR